ncbi:MAG: hypothetical protein ACYC7A_12445 [Thermoanaerobaculia bacterium]
MQIIEFLIFGESWMAVDKKWRPCWFLEKSRPSWENLDMRSTVFFVVFLLMIPSLHGAPAVQNPSDATESPSLQTFDLTADKLPPRFKGASITAAFKAFRAAPKSEMETTAEFRERLANGSFPFGTYAFVIPAGFVATGYNPDTGALRLAPRVIYPANLFENNWNHPAIELSQENESSRTYPASNRYGATVQVREESYDSYSLLVNGRVEALVINNVPRSRAPELKDNARIAVVAQLDKDSVNAQYDTTGSDYTGYRNEEPTISRPFELTISDHWLRCRVLQFIVFDRISGEILGRFEPPGAGAPTR